MSERSLSYVQAFIEAVKLEMEADPNVFIAGEDVGAHGGVFHTFDGVQAQFGERRAVDTPISEQAIIGLGVGAALTGLRPIVDLMFMEHDGCCDVPGQRVQRIGDRLVLTKGARRRTSAVRSMAEAGRAGGVFAGSASRDTTKAA